MTFNEYIDFEVHELTSDVMEIRVPVKGEYENELGGVHGGAIMLVADAATGLLAIDRKYLAPTQSSYTNFLRPISMDSKYIYARAEVIKRGRRTVTIDCKVWGDDGKLAAVNRTECTVISDDVENNPTKLIKSFQDGTYKKY